MKLARAAQLSHRIGSQRTTRNNAFNTGEALSPRHSSGVGLQ